VATDEPHIDERHETSIEARRPEPRD